ncbi:HipA N-terminal domain-containing protein [Marivirga sp.]|uniref:HipA N-terminal domain-containing protein n=1 Tax=Marivirga sp. TaxID=2018662 RepID=UPI0025CDD01A|nr:HipA N-terminal domain-containing protein [Marivirga sp.]
MSRKAAIYNNKVLAGYLEKIKEGEYLFQYEEDYLADSETSAISLTLPKSEKIYRSKLLFPFFFGLLSEGVNKLTQCRLLKIDEEDHFSLLMKTAKNDTIGAITVKELSE